MRRLSHTVPPGWDGVPIKAFAKKYLGFSTHVLAGLKRQPEGILLNGRQAFTTAPLHEGDTLVFTLPREQKSYPAAALSLSILFENDDFLFVSKPAGMPIHPSPGHNGDSLLHAAAYYYSQKGPCPLICPLYRLDKDTTGIVALGKHTLAVSGTLARKVYFAVCQGTLSGHGTIDLPIGLEEGSKIKRRCGHGQRAVTHWRALAGGDGHTLIAASLETGRTHQIRVHFAHLGHPLAGDGLYGGSQDKITRQALHCGILTLSSRALSMHRMFTLDFPPDMRQAFPWLPGVGELKADTITF